IEVVTLEIFGDEESKPLASYRDEALARLITPVENLLTTRKADDVGKARTMTGGGSVMIFLDVALDANTQPLGELHHRFSFDLRKNPDLDRTVNGPTIAVIRDPPPVLQPPLRGSGWVAFNALSAID